MIVEKGEKLHIITRRLFEGDLRRHFLGEIVELNGALSRMIGYSFIFDPWANEFVKLPDKRDRIFNLAEAGLIVNILPQDLQIAVVEYRNSRDGRLIMTDGSGFRLDINEFSSKR